MLSFDGRELAAVFVGGALGTLARVGLATFMATDPSRWPWPTFIVNIVGVHLFLAPEGLPVAAFLVLANGFLAWRHREAYRPLLRP